jgi:exopolyphosphatase / guanosine-5'-triphosphate,3'-diphosphate pyrophosphatase
MVGIIDLGSNTARMNIYDVEKNQLSLVFSEKKTIGLASYIDQANVLSNEGIERAITVIKKFIKLAKRFELDSLHAIATASLRNAVNGSQALEQINNETNINMKILTGKEEAIADLQGVRLSIPFDDGILLDIGGGSSELVVYVNQEIQYADAIPIGSLNSYMNHVKRLLATEKEMKTIEKSMLQELKKITVSVPNEFMIYGIGGTIRGARKLYNHVHDLESSNNFMTRYRIEELVASLLNNKKSTQIDLVRIAPERVHTLLPGLAILLAVMKQYDLDEVTVNHQGIREGYLIQQLT